MSFELTRVGDVYVLTMDAEDNRFNRASLARLNELLDEVEHSDGPAALVTTGTGKFYSNGLDLEWVMGGDSDMTLGELAAEAQKLMARTLTFPRPTVAAINGHCFAAAAMWSLCHDLRIMRRDRGFWSLPEVDLKIPFTEGMGALIQHRLSPQVAHIAMTTAHRFGGEHATAADIVGEAVAGEHLMERAIAVAGELAGKDPGTLGFIKRQMYASVVAALVPTD